MYDTAHYGQATLKILALAEIESLFLKFHHVIQLVGSMKLKTPQRRKGIKCDSAVHDQLCHLIKWALVRKLPLTYLFQKGFF